MTKSRSTRIKRLGLFGEKDKGKQRQSLVDTERTRVEKGHSGTVYVGYHRFCVIRQLRKVGKGDLDVRVTTIRDRRVDSIR